MLMPLVLTSQFFANLICEIKLAPNVVMHSWTIVLSPSQVYMLILTKTLQITGKA